MRCLILFVFIVTYGAVCAQQDTICGSWVKDPEYPPGTITHFSIRKRGNGYEIYRTKEPSQKWSAMWDQELGHYLAIVDGLLLGISWSQEKDRVLVFHEKTKESLFEMKRDLNKEDED
jgi:hypothetical protein